MSELLVRGARLACQQVGEGPDLVFVHGLAASRAFWFAQYVLPLQDRFRITCFDLRGHGYSERTASGYSATAMAEDLAGVLDALDVQRCDLVGHSYGGGVALEFAVQQPQRLRSLTVLDTKVNALQPTQRLADMPQLSAFEIEVAQRSGIDWEAEDQIGLRFLEAVARLRAAGETIPVRDSVTPFGEGRGALRTAKAWLELIDTPGVREELLQAGAAGERIADRLAALPVQLIYGGLSRCQPSCRALSQRLPSADVVLLPDGGHFFPLSHAALVREKLLAFWERHRSR